MIENFRKIAKNPIMKALMLVLVVSFMLSGLSAGFLSQSQTDNYIVEVAGEKIYPSQIEAEYKNIARNFSERGMQVDDKMLADLGVTQEKILNDLVQRKLIFAEVEQIGLTVSDDLLRKEILNAPIFQANGKFDADMFKRFLYIRGLREHQYLDEMRKEISGEAMMSILLGDIETPARVFELLKNRAATRFDIDGLLVAKDSAELKVAVTDEQLRDFHFTNSSVFERPESRSVSLASMKKLADVSKSLEMATAIEDDIAGGSTLDEIIKKNDLKLAQKTYVKQEPDSPSNSKAYQMQEGEIEIIENEESYLIIQLDKISEKHVPDLADIKAEVEQAWRDAEKQKLSKQLAIDLYESKKFDTSGFKTQSFNKISSEGFAENGFSKLRGVTPAEAKQGEVFGLYETIDGSYLITRLSGKSIATLTDKELETYKQMFGNAYATELQQSYLNYLAAKHGVEFNEKYEKK